MSNRLLLRETSGTGEGPWEAWVDGEFVCRVKDKDLASKDLDPAWEILGIQVDFEVGWEPGPEGAKVTEAEALRHWGLELVGKLDDGGVAGFYDGAVPPGQDLAESGSDGCYICGQPDDTLCDACTQPICWGCQVENNTICVDCE